MIKVDPIIAVRDIDLSTEWYRRLFDCERAHGGDEFAVLKDSAGEILLCLHKWGTHRHPTMQNSEITAGNGLILYYKTDQWEEIRQKADKASIPVEEEVHLNLNSNKMEFSLRDPDGYFWTVTEFHEYEG